MKEELLKLPIEELLRILDENFRKSETDITIIGMANSDKHGTSRLQPA